MTSRAKYEKAITRELHKRGVPKDECLKWFAEAAKTGYAKTALDALPLAAHLYEDDQRRRICLLMGWPWQPRE